MATTTMAYTGPADGQASLSFAHQGSIPDAAAPQFFACYRAAYGNYFDNVLKVVTQSAKDSTGAANAVATDAQVFDAFAQGIANGVAAQVTLYAKAQAAASAAAGVPALTVTKVS